MTSPYQVKAYRGDEPFAFVSYAHEDADAVYAEIARLHTRGFNIYYDEGIHPGHTWHDDLANAIERCTIFVLFVTANSVASRNCQRELTFALDKECEVLAVHLEEVQLPSGLQLAMGDRQAILGHRFSQDEYRSRLTEAIEAYLPTRSESAEPQRTEPRRPKPPPSPPTQGRRSNTPVMLAIGAFVAIVALAIWWSVDTTPDSAPDSERAAVASREFFAAVDRDDAVDAYLAAESVDEATRQTDRFKRAWPRVTSTVRLAITTPNATVEFRPYGSSAAFTTIGTTPLKDAVTLPRSTIELRLSADGFDTQQFAVKVPGPLAASEDYWGRPNQVSLALQPTGTLPEGMVRVPATEMPIWVSGWSRTPAGDNAVALPAFNVARQEVSNRDFQQFVDAGGYRTQAYWEGLKFEADGEVLSPADALAQFVDETGQAAPAGWSLGRFPQGEADLPVAGISWYEAVAYARYRGLTLPTMHHWARYAHGPMEGLAHITPSVNVASNFSRRSASSTADARGLGAWGTFDTSGNVREWIWNRTGQGAALAMGGSWTDYATNAGLLRLDPMSRSPFVGMRLIQLIDGADPALLEPVTLVFDDPSAHKQPVSDEAFAMLRYQFSADQRVHVAADVDVIESNDLWQLELHTLTYADGTTFKVYLARPARPLPRYQAVVYGPHGGGFAPPDGPPDLDDIKGLISHGEKVVRSGRLLAMPVWSGSLDRWRPRPVDPQAFAERQRRGALAWYQDSVDVVNYLDTLDYVNHDKTAYLAESYGTSVFGVMLMAMQPRFDAAIFLGSGLWLAQTFHPLLDAVNYAPRVTRPMLMVNGEFDPVFPHRESQKPLFELLGTPEADKRMVLYPGGHFRYPDNLLAREIAQWLDTYLGPVN